MAAIGLGRKSSRSFHIEYTIGVIKSLGSWHKFSIDISKYLSFDKKSSAGIIKSYKLG
jgi:hypothetical protein